jgi:hypothetical protein
MGVLPQAPKIIFEGQRKMINEKITRRNNKLCSLQNAIFFSSLWTPPTFKPHNFPISYSFKMT